MRCVEICVALSLIILIMYFGVAETKGEKDNVDVKMNINDDIIEESKADKVPEDEAKEVEVDPEKLEYAKGSVCSYCTYCKFCALCDRDCPCETGPTKPNCKMCKYCKYCNLCSAVCETVCTPGGILDRVSGAIVNALPTVNKEEVNNDIASVEHWINKEKDEL